MDFMGEFPYGSMSSELSYGIFIRMIGVVYVVCFWSFAVQLPTLAGRHGLEPLGKSLATKRRHFGWRAFWYYPTLFWLFNTELLLDTMLWVLPTLGCVCGGLVVYGGASTPYLLGACWLILLSIDAGPTLLVYPWDSLLLEVGFLCLWLPGTVGFSGGLGSLEALHAPSPLHSFAFRWLAFRVLVGFGKLKFVGSEWRDRLYIRGFLINQPMVSPLGWWAHHALPDWVWVASLGGMFVVEMVAPFGFFATGLPRVVASASIAGLMVGIWATGNYGYFNILTMALCMGAVDQGVSAHLSFTSADLLPPGSGPLFLSAASAASASSVGGGVLLPLLQRYLHLSPPTLATQWPSLLLSTLLLTYILPLSAILFVMNSWINMSWAFWGGVYRLRVHPALWWTQAYAGVLRSLQQFRVVAAYGVFPPHTSPSQRWALVYEGSEDGVTFHRYHYKHYLSSPTTPPAFIAPFHPRLDHAIFYESFGSAGTPIAALGHNNPYAYHTSCNAWKSLQVKLLLGGKEGAGMAPFFSHNPFPDPAKPPTYVRIQAYQYTPHTPAHAAATGEYWKERSIGTQYECLSLNDLRAASGGGVGGGGVGGEPLWPLSDVAPEPEEFWCEFEEWRKRARVASKGVTQREYEEAWKFLGELRALAAEEGLALSRAARGEGEGVGKGEGKGGHSRASSAGRRQGAKGGESRRRKASTTSTSKVVAGEEGEREAAADADADAPPSMARLCAQTYVREPSDKSALEKAAQEVSKACSSSSSSPGPLSPTTAATLFTWEVLPGTVARVREKYTMAQLVALRGTLNRLVIPLLRGAQRVFDRVAPTEEEIKREWEEVLGNGGGGATAVPPEGMHEMMGRSPPAPPTLPSSCPSSSSSSSSFPSLRFKGNDDASPQGAMSSSLRWLQHAHRVMLVGGRDAYEASAGGLLGRAVGSSNLAEPLELWSDQDHLATLPRPLAYHHLTGGAQGGVRAGVPPSPAATFSPATMTTELSTFLLFTLTYDSLHTMAVNHARVAAQSRPTPPTVLPHFLPAILALTPRIQAHPVLRVPIPGARGRGDGGGKAGGKKAGGPGEEAAAILPFWELSQDGTSWHQLEHY